MNSLPDWAGSSGEVITALASRIWAQVPGLLAALLLILVGYLAARLLRGAAVQALRGVDALVQRVYQRHGLETPVRALASARVLGEIVFWVVMLFFLTAATHMLGIDTFTTWMNKVVGYLPTLVVGALIILAGILLSNLARDLVVAATPIEPGSRQLLGRAVQVTILVLAVVIGAGQIGINTTFLIIIASVLLGTVLGGLALAMSLGARTFVANLIGTRYLREAYRPGQRIRIGEHEGVILDFTPTAVVLETAAGRTMLPGKMFQDTPSVLVVEDGDRESS